MRASETRGRKPGDDEMYLINYVNGTSEHGINFIEACRQIQCRPSCNWAANIGEWIDGQCEVRLNGRLIATIVVAA